MHGKGTELGPERMVFSHGKNAVQLWTRMVANGTMVEDFNVQGMMNTNESGKGGDKSDNESMSNLSTSSSSYSDSLVHS